MNTLTAEIRKRRIAHAITLTQHVRQILVDCNDPFDLTAPSDNVWTKTKTTIDLIEVLLQNLEALHADAKTSHASSTPSASRPAPQREKFWPS